MTEIVSISIQDEAKTIRRLIEQLGGLTLGAVIDMDRIRLWNLVDQRTGAVLFTPVIAKPYGGDWTPEIGKARTLALLISKLINHAPALLDAFEELSRVRAERDELLEIIRGKAEGEA